MISPMLTYAPQEVRDRRLVLYGDTSGGRFGDVIRPENNLIYVGVNGMEVEEGLSYDNHQQAMVIADLCSGLRKLILIYLYSSCYLIVFSATYYYGRTSSKNALSRFQMF
jgi:hypothetical protein